MFHKIALVSVCALVALATSGELPSSFQKCDRKKSDFDQCLTKAVEDAIRKMIRPYKEAGLTNLKPLKIPAMTIGAGTGAVAFQQNYKNIELDGFDKIECSRVKMDFAQKFIHLDCVVPKIVMTFNYEINGRLLVLPIVGNGPGTIILAPLKIDFTLNLDEFDKGGKKHYKTVSQKLNLTPEFMEFKLENLFDGDKALGDNINKVLNENWKEVFADVKASYDDAFGQVFANVFNRMGEKVSIETLFGSE